MYTFTLTVTDRITEKVIYTKVYKGYSNTEMMDEQKHLYQFYWPRDKYRIDW